MEIFEMFRNTIHIYYNEPPLPYAIAKQNFFSLQNHVKFDSNLSRYVSECVKITLVMQFFGIIQFKDSNIIHFHS